MARHSVDVRLITSGLYFAEIRRTRKALDAAIAHLEAQRSLLEPIGVTIGDVVSGGGKVSFDDRVIDLTGMRLEYCDALAEFSAVEEEAERVLSTCRVPNGAAVLRLFYLDGFPVEQIARWFNVDRSTLYRWRRAALIDCYDALSEEWKRALPNAEVV